MSDRSITLAELPAVLAAEKRLRRDVADGIVAALAARQADGQPPRASAIRAQARAALRRTDPAPISQMERAASELKRRQVLKEMAMTASMEVVEAAITTVERRVRAPLSVRCEYCGADAGSPCMSSGDTPRAPHHGRGTMYHRGPKRVAS